MSIYAAGEPHGDLRALPALLARAARLLARDAGRLPVHGALLEAEDGARPRAQGHFRALERRKTGFAG